MYKYERLSFGPHSEWPIYQWYEFWKVGNGEPMTSQVLVLSHTFVEIDHEIISTVILLPSADSRRVVSYKRGMCTKYWLTA